AEDGIRDFHVTGVQTCALPICQDDDCNGIVDDGNPEGGAACGTDTGECSIGAEVCRGGVLVCEGATGPRVEICNGRDDDCDGIRSEERRVGREGRSWRLDERWP